MTLGLRRAAVHLALAAMLLRAFLPAGWMPGVAAGGEPALVICSVDAPLRDDGGLHKGRQAPDGRHAHEECPFAAAPHVAAPASVAQLALPAAFGRFSSPPPASAAAATAAPYRPGSPRAPPRNA